jgi:GH24 family phage-related lysozyme (muramidase)
MRGSTTIYREPPGPCTDLVHLFDKGPNGDFSEIAYNDLNGERCIGWRHRIVSDLDLKESVINRAKADQLLSDDLIAVAKQLCERLPIALVGSFTNGQWATLIDFAFDQTVRRFERSAIYSRVLAADFHGVANEFPRWVYTRDDRGRRARQVCLADRRLDEQQLWLRDGDWFAKRRHANPSVHPKFHAAVNEASDHPHSQIPIG